MKINGHKHKMSQKLYIKYILPFCCGFCILSYEMTSIRKMVPYFGSNTIVWTNIFGVFILALAIGYYLGGRIAQKTNSKWLLLSIPLISAGCILISTKSTPFIINILSHQLLKLNSIQNYLFLGSFSASIILFLIPTILLAMISPYVITISTKTISTLGQSSGTIYATSTLGSLIGIILTEIILLPLLGITITLNYIVTILITVSIIGLITQKNIKEKREKSYPN